MEYQKNNIAVLICGPPAAGKSTISLELANELKKRGKNVYYLSGDNIANIVFKRTITDESLDWKYNCIFNIIANFKKENTIVIFDDILCRNIDAEMIENCFCINKWKVYKFKIHAPLRTLIIRNLLRNRNLSTSSKRIELYYKKINYSFSNSFNINTKKTSVKNCVKKIMEFFINEL